jgi:hypothetical protein
MQRELKLPVGRTEPARQVRKILGMRCGLAARGLALSGTKEGNMMRLAEVVETRKPKSLLRCATDILCSDENCA